MLKRNILSIIILSVCICSVINSCTSKKKQVVFDYGTKNDSALFYFHKGWEHIMDKGQWTLSESSFRKAYAHDPNFFIGLSLVGRISGNLEERIAIKEILDTQKEKLTEDQRLLLDVYLLNIDIMNTRSQSPDKTGAIVKKFRALSEENYRTFVHKYPHESYIKAEYIEVLHARYGAQQAIDSLQVLTSQEEIEEVAFFKSYLASLEAALGNYDTALSYADEVVAMHNDTKLAGPHATYAAIYFKMDSLSLAKKHIDKAVTLNPMHIIAQGLKSDIDKRLEE